MNKENFEEAYIRSNAYLAFIIAEGKRATKRKRNIATGRDLSPEKAKAARREREGASADELPAHSSRRRRPTVDDIFAHSYRDRPYRIEPDKGSERGVPKVRGSNTETQNTKEAQERLKARLMAKHGDKVKKSSQGVGKTSIFTKGKEMLKRIIGGRKVESTMNQENFERAYVESQAQIALVLAESLGLISEGGD